MNTISYKETHVEQFIIKYLRREGPSSIFHCKTIVKRMYFTIVSLQCLSMEIIVKRHHVTIVKRMSDTLVLPL